ncbi:MAG: aspartate aminotransferase family protein [Rhodospirillaceae bacterium]|jgi:acetylornithine/N-succinyldiaminopimelate aminotransferase|nr:aspartate aminotransferase family protein [Rhodospirillales bacterium]MBT3908041.1 aspartate aminotransferase family protein [Rhodospirillaceae bacterium]MBT5033884.1 aspartate aminotransferase family protein [Rhodospirillaceae bacterium]MBT6361637.1 aspartate aminotransferase family protein [Rhodospirillaceae bacterium]
MNSSVMNTYGRYDLSFASGEGAYIVATDGRRFLDFGSGIAVTSLGHCHPHLVKTLQDQAATLWHCSNLYSIPNQDRLAQRLVENSFADRVFFANSGAEAVEAGLKMVRKYHDDNGNPEKYRVISCENSFHGRTMATISAGGQEKHLMGFSPIVEGFDHVRFGNLNEMRAAVTKETAAILVEPVQGEGGIYPAPENYLKSLREIADEFGLLLFFDEVQTGIGRTGKLFAHEWAGVTPDIMSLAKGLGGGFPIGACLATEKAAALTPGSHGSTFGGNPLATAAGNAVLDIILEDGFLDNVNQSTEKLMGRVNEIAAKHPKIIESVRGAGLLIGMKCVVPNSDLIGKLHDLGMLTVPAGDNIARLIPPLIIGDKEIEEAAGMIEKACEELE